MPIKVVSAVKAVLEAGAELGEGPVWDEESETVLWVDIKGRRLHSYNVRDDENHSIELPTEVGAVALRKSGGLVAATREGFALLDLRWQFDGMIIETSNFRKPMLSKCRICPRQPISMPARDQNAHGDTSIKKSMEM